jgi:hypothetical protein
VDRARLELGMHAAFDVQQREDRRVREEPRQLQQHLLAAAHAGQPVVDERDAHALSHHGGADSR